MNKARYGEINLTRDCFLVLEREDWADPEWEAFCAAFHLDDELTERITIEGTVKYFGAEKRKNV